MAKNILTDSFTPEEIQKLYVDLVETSQDLIWQTDSTGHLIFLNPAWEKTLGYTNQEMLGRTFTDFQTPEVAQQDLNEFSRILHGDPVKEYETVYLSKSNKEIHLVFNAKAVCNQKGDMIGCRGTAYDITERKQAEEALKLSEATIKNKLKAITDPDGDIGNLTLSEIIDTEVLQTMMDDFYQLTGMLGAVLDISGNILVAVGWQDICTQFHRCNPETLENCIESDTILSSGVAEGEFKMYHCKNNMCDMVTPIMLGGKHIGNVFFGQFFYDDEIVDVELFRKQAQRYGFDEEDYLAALDRVPRFSKEEVTSGMRFYAELAKIVSTLSYSAISQSRMLAKSQKTEAALKKSEFFFKESQRAALIGSYQSEFYPNDSWKTSEVCDEIFGIDDNYDKTVQGWTNLLHPDSAEEMVRYVTDDVIGRGILFNKEYQIIRYSDGEARWVLGLGETIQDATGRTTGLIGTIQDITERKSAEALSRQIQFSIDNIADSVFWIDEMGHIIYVNNAACKNLGYSKEELLTLSVFDVDPMFTTATWQDHWQELASQGSLKIETLHKTKEGQDILVNVTTNSVELGGTTFNCAVAHDVTKEKQAEKELLISHARHAAMLTNIGDVIGIMGADGLIKYKSPNIMKWFGWKPEDLIGKEAWTTVHPDDIKKVQQAFFKVLKKDNAKTTLEFRYKCKDERFTWVELTAVNCCDNSAIEGVLINYRDISERKQVEEELLLSENRLRSLFQNLTSSLSLYEVIYDENKNPIDYKIIAVNPMYEKTVDVREKDVLGKTLLEAFPQTESAWLETMHRTVTTGRSLTIEDYAQEVKKWIEITLYVPEEGQLAMIATDVSERKEAQQRQEKLTEQLHQSQKMEAVGQLAGGIAHDFNNSLSGIIGAAELIQRGKSGPEKQKKYIDMIILAAERAGELSKKLLLFSRKGVTVSSSVDMEKVVSDTVEILNHTINKNISISFSKEALQTVVTGDESLLQNTLLNIGINASKAMPDGGRLDISLNNILLDTKYCQSSPFEIIPGNYLQISLKDTGVGMSPEVQEHIFEPFYTTRNETEGTGLGLATAYGTIQEHAGAVTVTSELGKGTTFELYFPITEACKPDTEELVPISGTGTILVIDDEELIRITASAILEDLGYRVFCAKNGQHGVDIFQEEKDKVDLILLDMIMPIMSGREAFMKLREIDPQIPIVIASGFAKESELADLQERGISGSLQKPFRHEALAQMVADILQKKQI